MSNDLTLAICLLAFAAFFVGFVIAMMLLSDRVYHSEADAIFKPMGNYNTGTPTIPRDQVPPPPKPKKQ